MAERHQFEAERHDNNDGCRSMISVIVPVFNAEEWLRVALESLKLQTYTDFEAILINDGSTDQSERICREFCDSDSRFRLLNQANAGVSAARNLGLDKARGEWIAFLDADDALPEDALERLMWFARESKAAIIAGRYLRGLSDYTRSDSSNSIVVSSEEAILTGLYQKRILNSPCGILFRSCIFNDNPILRFRKCRYEDLDIFYRAFERAEKICLTDKITYFYRDTPGSFINTWSDARLDVLDVTDRMVDHMKGRSERLLRAAEDRRFSAHFNMLMEMERHKVENAAQKKRCLNVIKEQRLNELTDCNVRLKNKLGALFSYLGMPAIRLLCRF